ncbi:MAG: hypothetical protein HOH58_05495 [Opitutaceae bacterium]|jgi:hypothetical protein|nr:hypothetical protein [Opitutaceae bacterium]
MHGLNWRSGLGLTVALTTVITVSADQPVFNEMPRWDNGWGVQFVAEQRREKDLMSGGRVVSAGFSEEVDLMHVEGVYTWDKSIRITAKLPLVMDAQREFPDGLGGKRIEHDKGVGDATLALPLKRYFNLDGRSGSWTLAPQVRVPMGAKDNYTVYHRDWGTGISAGYETETYRYLLSIGVDGWIFEGDAPALASGHIDLGINFNLGKLSGHVKWETDYLAKEDGTEKLYIGPHLYLKLTDTVHAQLMYKREAHARRNQLDHGNGTLTKLGIAFVF